MEMAELALEFLRGIVPPADVVEHEDADPGRVPGEQRRQPGDMRDLLDGPNAEVLQGHSILRNMDRHEVRAGLRG